jgi:NAD(P)-dependent dehydrogenase (short-subunit alcohol dehydrogenase family)
MKTPRLRGKIMMELAGKTAFVTGGASGIGLALGQAFAQVGMNVMLADIESTALTTAVRGLSDQGLTNVCSVTCDVSDPVSVEEGAEATYKAFGAVHVVCNNAGVGGGDRIKDISVEDWRWVVDVNLMGVVHGVRTFLPHIRGHRQGGHIVNTASMAGMIAGGFSPYSASKFAVVSMSEGLAMQLAPLDIGVTLLCPGFVRTRIMECDRNRQGRYGPARVPLPGSRAAMMRSTLTNLVNSGLDPLDVARRVVTAIRQNELYVFTHAGPEWRSELERRFNTILLAMDKAAGSEKLETEEAETGATAA